MKTVYIPKGETVTYETLETEHLVVNGCLKVTYGVKAKTISGSGVISAGTVSADSIRADELEAAAIFCERLVAKRVQAPEVFASESAAVSCFLSAAYVETPKLTVAMSEIDGMTVDEVVNLRPRKRSLFGTLLASFLRSLWTALTVRPVREELEEVEQEPEKASEPVDEELNRIIGMFKLARESGYTLKLVPGTPEENAPVFDFASERIIRRAA